MKNKPFIPLPPAFKSSFFVVVCLAFPCVSFADSPPLLLAKTYKQGVSLSDYWVSEKLDGVRAFWDGKQLISRQGNVFRAPAWFVKGFPEQALDGELWIARGRFEEIVSTVKKHVPNDNEWRQVKYMVFDLPRHKGTFTERLNHLKALFNENPNANFQLVRQEKVKTHDELKLRLDEIVSAGGEGLMLHKADSRYRSGRHGDMLKVKTYEDAEAKVIAHLPGKGKYKKLLGALLVEAAKGLRFSLGSGFSDAERATPPPVGSIITYKFYGKTRNGLPRFASFLRVRNEIVETVVP